MKILFAKKKICDKYSLQNNDTVRELRNKQNENLINKLKTKKIHGTFFNNIEKLNLLTKNSCEWLKNRVQNSQTEAFNFLIQDRLFGTYNKIEKSTFCQKSKISIDHIATRCGNLLHTSYIRRHNEVAKAIHLRLALEYGFKKSKKLKHHKMEKVIKNENAEIISDLPIITDSHIKHNKPDIIIQDFRQNITYIIEIGITSADNLRKVEVEKYEKYRLLGKEIEIMYGRKTIIIPYVLTWDGITTEYNKKYRKLLGINNRLHGYIQCISMKLTSEIILSSIENSIHKTILNEEDEKDGYKKYR
ncbi:hypothetical protein DMUE_4575 [Dictyocoela muelleri]|nr:hypothetical protein DMUE_4575 [Dictyocoela muelleri]